jgi:hypothetical protein
VTLRPNFSSKVLSLSENWAKFWYSFSQKHRSFLAIFTIFSSAKWNYSWYLEEKETLF